MKYELIFKGKVGPHSSFVQMGKIVVPPEHLNTQFASYEARAKRMDLWDHVVLVNELDDEGNFVRTVH